MTEKKRLVREVTSARPRSGRLEREGASVSERGERDRDVRGERGDREGASRTRIRRGRTGRPPLLDEVGDINRGLVYVGVESTAIAMDIVSRVLRGAIDRAFDEDYENPGDIVRGIAGETDLAVYDLVSELRHVPRRLSYRFDDAVRSPRSDEGERKRKADEAPGRRDGARDNGAPRDPSGSNGRLSVQRTEGRAPRASRDRDRDRERGRASGDEDDRPDEPRAKAARPRKARAADELVDTVEREVRGSEAGPRARPRPSTKSKGKAAGKETGDGPASRTPLSIPKPVTAGDRAVVNKSRVPIEVPAERSLVKPPGSRRAEVLAAFFRFLAAFLFDEIVRRVPLLSRFVDEDAPRNPVRLRRLLESLGGAFIKFGQLFSMRADILPPEYCRALATLFDDVAPFPTAEARAIVEKELGKPIDELFHTFEEVPLGAASFGQVHLATLKGGSDDGQLAAVKICRPGSEETIEIDGQLLLLLGYIVDAMSLLGRIKLVPVFRDFVKWTRKEINYLQEGKNADHLHELTHWNPRQRIPYIYWDKTTQRVCTMELLDGISVSEIIRRVEEGDESVDQELEAMGCDRLTIARNVWQTFLLQAFVGCAFHGDPHPGNLIVMPENVVGFIDFGLLGRMNEEARREQALMLDAIARENIERLFVASLDILDAPRGLLVTDTYDEFCEGADAWLDACDNPGVPMAEKSMNRMVQACMNIARTVGLVLPTQTMLFYKGILTIDSVVLRVFPDFDYKKESKRAVRLIRMRELDKATTPGNVLDSALLTQMLVSHVPDFVAGRIQDFEQGQRLIYRKLNLVPVILAGVFQVLSIGLLALFGALVADRFGLLARAWKMPGAEPVQRALGFLSPYFVIVLVLALVSAWLVRAMKARSFVKVQREG